MRVFQFDNYDENGQCVTTMTEAEIMESYWPYWKKQMEKKFGVGSDLITQAHCLDDWIVVHWAWETSEPA